MRWFPKEPTTPGCSKPYSGASVQRSCLGAGRAVGGKDDLPAGAWRIAEGIFVSAVLAGGIGHKEVAMLIRAAAGQTPAVILPAFAAGRLEIDFLPHVLANVSNI